MTCINIKKKKKKKKKKRFRVAQKSTESLANLLYIGLSLHFTAFGSTPLNHCLDILNLFTKYPQGKVK